MKITGKNTALCLLLFLSVACKEEPAIPQTVMVDVMADISLLEAGNQLKYNGGLLPDKVWERDYDFIFKKHKVSAADFKQTIAWYRKHPEVFSKTMEKVITRLQSAELKASNKPKTPVQDASSQEPPVLKVKPEPAAAKP
ncbi:MAG: DUF4296 domain-containing protein [Bacteroidetes bacterium]|nr:DUF4296 domain-containing protein [Bacteroidota bacterium]